MTESLTGLRLDEFCSALAAKRAVPGGGGAAALTGALGVALCSMAGNFTVGKPAYAHVEDELKRMLAEAEDVQKRLVALVDEDARAFERVSQSWRIPKDDPARAERVEEATRNACQAPLEMMRQCGRALKLLEEMEEAGSHLLLSDVAAEPCCARRPWRRRVSRVVNTTSLHDRALAHTIESEADALLDTWLPRTRRVGDAGSVACPRGGVVWPSSCGAPLLLPPLPRAAGAC